MHLQEGLVPLCNHLYVTKGAILYGAVSDVSALHAFMCKEMLDLRKKASFFQGIGANPLFALTKTHLYYVISQKGTYYPLGRAFHA